MKRIAPIIILLLTTACAFNRVPPETAVASAEVGKEIGNLRKTVKDLVELAADELRAHYEERLEFTYIPKTIDDFLTTVNFQGKACKLSGHDRGVEVQKILKAINKKIRKQRAAWFDPIDKEERADLKFYDEYFDDLDRMQGGVTRNVSSAVKGQELQKLMFDAVKSRSKTLRRMDAAREKVKAKINKYIE